MNINDMAIENGTENFEQIDLEAQIKALLKKHRDPLKFSADLARATQSLRDAYERRLHEITCLRDKMAEHLALQEQLRRTWEESAESSIRLIRELRECQRAILDAQIRLQDSEEWTSQNASPIETMIAGFDQQVARVNADMARRKLATKPFGSIAAQHPGKQQQQQHSGKKATTQPKVEEQTARASSSSNSNGHGNGSSARRRKNTQNKLSDAQWGNLMAEMHRDMIPDDPTA